MEPLTTTYGPSDNGEQEFTPPVPEVNRVRAKFRCNNVIDYGTQKQANLSAVYSKDTKENADFTQATPYGELKINIDSSMPAAKFFEPQGEYYLVFEKVPGTAV